MVAKINFEKEESINKTSSLKWKRLLSVSLKIVILVLFSWISVERYGFENLPLWFWAILLGIFIISLIPDKTISFLGFPIEFVGYRDSNSI
jgi:hypothetical protein